MQKIREGFIRLIEQNNPPELRWFSNVRSKLCSIKRICQGFFMVKNLQKYRLGLLFSVKEPAVNNPFIE
jgi:hypothetical protein